LSTLHTFSSEAEPETLEALQEIAAREGREFHAVLGEAIREYVAQKRQQGAKRTVLEAFQESLKDRDELFRSLARSDGGATSERKT
jgi:predicted transcriptional regulator